MKLWVTFIIVLFLALDIAVLIIATSS